MYFGRATAVSATRFLRKLRGGSQPILVGASDGKQYVVKFPNNLQGPNLLSNEVLGIELYRALGLPVAGWIPIRVTESFIAENPGAWIEDAHARVKPQSGLCFGSALVGSSADCVLEILPGGYWGRVSNRFDFWRAWLVDLCAEHRDNRQAVFVSKGKELSAVFIDHGHMFGGPEGGRKTPVLGPRHLDTRAYAVLDSELEIKLRRFCATLNTDELLKKAALIPDAWVTDSAIRSFSDCIDRLSRSELWERTLQAMLSALEDPAAYGKTFPISERRESPPVLHRGLQTGRLTRGAVA